MTLVDTSIWVDHLRSPDATLDNLLARHKVLCHPLVVGEIAMGSFRRRDKILHELGRLPRANSAEHREVLRFISQHSLFGIGIGYIDAHLLASVRLTQNASLWTRDQRLAKAAESMKLAFRS
jgi:hypothetical protein